MLDVPVECLLDPQAAILEFTIENGAWQPGSKLPRYFAEAQIVYREPTLNQVFGLDNEDPAIDRVRFPRNADLRGLVDEEAWANAGIEDRVKKVQANTRLTLGTKTPGLGPNEWIQYDQKPAWQALIAPQDIVPSPYGKVLQLACGRGKTVLGLLYAQHLGVRTLVVCHTLNMAKQWAKEAAVLIGMSYDDIGFIGDGEVDWLDKSLVFSSMQGLICRKYPDQFWNYFGLEILDEGDLFAASTMRLALPMHTCERLLVTATYDRQDGNEQLLDMHIGPTVFKDIEEDVQPQVEVHLTPVPDFLPVEITIKGKVQIQYRPAEKTVYSRRWRRQIANIPKTVTGLREYPPRFYFALEVVFELLEQGRKILFLGERVTEIQDMDEVFTENCADYDSGIFLGAKHMSAEAGLAYLADSDVCFAIQQLGKRGLNERRLDTVVIQYSTFNDPGKLRQTVGRALRYYPDKEYPKVVLLGDRNVPCLWKNTELIVERLRDQGCEVEWVEYG